MRKRKPSVLQRYNRMGYWFVLPWVIGFLTLMLGPLLQTIRFATGELTITQTGYTIQDVGFSHFLYAFGEDANFPKLLANSLWDMVIDVPILLVFSFFAAVLLRRDFRGNKLVKGIFFITVIMSSGVFVQMQNETMNINTVQLNSAMSANPAESISIGNYLIEAGLDESLVGYLATPVDALFSVMTRSGVQIFIFLAGLSSISPALYEACSMEGATGWETFWLITFPMTSPLIIVNLIYSIVDSFMSDDNAVLRFIHEQAFSDLDYGYASALSWIYFLAVAAIIGLAIWLISKYVVYHT